MSSVTDLRVAIIGAGMGGLSCALALAQKGFKHIDVYEMASDLGFVGAGIQLAPNLARVLTKYGCWDEIEKEATNVVEASIREGASNKELAHVDMPDIREKYGFPHCTGHRAHLAGGIYKAIQQHESVKFHFGGALKEINEFGPPTITFTIQPREGDEYKVETDILLASDGIKSVTRAAMLGALGLSAEVEDTGQAAYRIMLTREDMKHDPEMLALLDSNAVTRWIGERRHIIAYAVSSHNIYNLSSCQPDTNFAAAPSALYTTKGSKPAMLKVFEDFCPLVHRMLDLVPDGEVCEWRLRSHKPLPTWTKGGVALVGDACHPTLPHLNQGAAMAIEDGATIAECLIQTPADADGKVTPEAAVRALKVYELLRKERTSTLVDLAAFSGRTLHLGEGKAKEERDKQFAAARERGQPVPDKWASPDVQAMIYSYDCIKDAQERFKELYDSQA